MKRAGILLWCMLLLIGTEVLAEYEISKIPKDLKEGAQMVVRRFDYQFTILDESKGVLKVILAYTVLSKEGNAEASLYLHYDNDREITDLSARFYSAVGTEFDKFKKSDFRDVKTGTGSLYTDSRMTYFKPSSTTYPYTVEYEYTIKTEKLLFYPALYPIQDEQVSLQKAVYQIQVPAGLKFRYKAKNIPDADPDIEKNDKVDKYTWTIRNIKPIRFEPYSEGYQDVFPILFIAPNKFNYAGYDGNFETWDDYAKWFSNINREKANLSDEYREKIYELTRGVTSNLEKTRIIYEYLQSHTRYISIQLGIGGYQSFPADITAENGYGDCKALTTYTKGMLEVAGVDSYYVLVRAGKNAAPIQSDFPSSQFNHVFLCVPVEQDTVWLECTSQTIPFGYIGSFTGNREVLIVNNNGGKIVRTPTFSAEENLQSRAIEVTLQENGDAVANIKTQYQGIQYENDGINYAVRKSREDQKKWLYKKIDITSFEIMDFSFEERRDQIPSIIEDLELNMRKFASISGKRMFIKPNLMNRYAYLPPEMENRISDIVLETPWTDIDSIKYIIPEGFYLESQSIDKSIKTDFGTYEVKVIQNSPDELLYIRKMVKFSGTYPKESYEALREFHKQVIRADKRKLVFARKT